MTYVPNPSDPTNPTTANFAGSMAAEFQALKLYIKQMAQTGYRRNLLINAAMNIDQLNSGSVYTISSGNSQYVIDQWIVSTSGTGGCTAQKLSGGPNGSGYCLSVVNGGSANSNIYQRIEAANSQALTNGTTVSVSGWIYVSTSGVSVIPYIYTPSTGVNNFSAGVTTVGTGTSFTPTPGSFYYFSQQIVLTGNCTYGAELGFVITNSAGATIQLTQVQLEVNMFATPFDVIPVALDLLECQRYRYVGVVAKQIAMPAGQYYLEVLNPSISMLNNTPTFSVISQVLTNCTLSWSNFTYIGYSPAVELTFTCTSNLSGLTVGIMSFYVNALLSCQL